MKTASLLAILLATAISCRGDGKTFSDEERAACRELLSEHQEVENRYFELKDELTRYDDRAADLAMSGASPETLMAAQTESAEALTRKLLVGDKLSRLRAEIEPLGCFDDSRF